MCTQATRRMMEKENMKSREVARKEYIAQIRSLTSYGNIYYYLDNCVI